MLVRNIFWLPKEGNTIETKYSKVLFGIGICIKYHRNHYIFWLFILTRQCFWNLFCCCFRILRMRKCLLQSGEIIAILISSSLSSDLNGLLVFDGLEMLTYMSSNLILFAYCFTKKKSCKLCWYYCHRIPWPRN